MKMMSPVVFWHIEEYGSPEDASWLAAGAAVRVLNPTGVTTTMPPGINESSGLVLLQYAASVAFANNTHRKTFIYLESGVSPGSSIEDLSIDVSDGCVSGGINPSLVYFCAEGTYSVHRCEATLRS